MTCAGKAVNYDSTKPLATHGPDWKLWYDFMSNLSGEGIPRPRTIEDDPI